MRSHTLVALALVVSGVALVSGVATDPGRSSGDTSAAGPPAVHWEGYAFDARRGALVQYGGSTGVVDGEVRYSEETWEWADNRWRRTATAVQGPGRRHAHGMAYHPEQRAVFLAGGIRVEKGKEQVLCDTWKYDGRWSRVATEGACRGQGATLVYDERRGSLLLIEGEPVAEIDRDLSLRIYRWASNRWVLTETGGPRHAYRARAAFDARRSVLVVLAMEGPDAGVWEWNGINWQHITTASGPSPRGAFGLAYDASTERIVLAGGQALSDDRPLDDVWAWNGVRWEELSGERPGARSHATLIEDRAGKRLLYAGGSVSGKLLRELWERRGAWSKVW